MRRDYFSCTFLFCMCASLFYVCFLPLYFTYDAIIYRKPGVVEIILSSLFAVFILLVIPIYSAIRRRIWITAGLATYGLLALLPVWLLPGLSEKQSIVDVVEKFLLKSIYSMVNAPFAGLTPLLGDKFCVSLSKWILPLSIGVYFVVQLYRYYRDAYIAEQLNPEDVVDSTAKENQDNRGVRDAKIPDILGTVISAPTAPTAPIEPRVKQAPVAQPSVGVKQPAPSAQPQPRTAVIQQPPIGQPAQQPKMDSGTGTNGAIELGAPSDATKRMPLPPTAPAAPTAPADASKSVYDENGAIRL